jgi:uncharacterized protein (TIGR03437 family)
LASGCFSPGLRGTYLYGDFCSGTIWGLQREGTSWITRLLASSGFSVTTFGEDEAGEIYVADAKGGAVYQILGSQASRFSAAAVVNAASFAPGISPGSAATVFAAGVLDDEGIVAADRLPLPPSLSGVSVTVDGITAPLFAVANQNGQEQVNFQAPFAIAGRQTANVVVTRSDKASAPVSVVVMELQPGIYASGGQAVVVHNADNTLATPDRPLKPGEYAYFYAAGLGSVSNAPADGAAAPQQPLAKTQTDVKVTLGGAACEVEFAGLAPLFAGVYQVNFRVPAAAAGGAQSLTVSAGPNTSPQAQVTVQ